MAQRNPPRAQQQNDPSLAPAAPLGVLGRRRALWCRGWWMR